MRFRQFSFRFEPHLKAALKRDVALRFITEKPPNHQLPRWINPTLPKYKFELKTTPNPPDAAITIFDGTQTAIAFNPNTRLTTGIDLWTTHPALIAHAKHTLTGFGGVFVGECFGLGVVLCGRLPVEWAMLVPTCIALFIDFQMISRQKTNRYMLPHTHRDLFNMEACRACGEKPVSHT